MCTLTLTLYKKILYKQAVFAHSTCNNIEYIAMHVVGVRTWKGCSSLLRHSLDVSVMKWIAVDPGRPALYKAFWVCTHVVERNHDDVSHYEVFNYSWLELPPF